MTAMTLVETIEVGAGGAASIEFTSIPQDADDLLLVVSARSDKASPSYTYTQIPINGSTANFTGRWLNGNGSSAASNVTSYLNTRYINAGTSTANTFANQAIYFCNYSSTTQYKSISVDAVWEDNATAADQYLLAGVWQSNSAITSLKFEAPGTNLVQYSVASLYKIVKAA